MSKKINKSILISESQFDSIHKGIKRKQVNDSIVITDWLSPDENYVIFLDELYDLKNKKNLGDVWENFDNLKFFLKHSFTVASNIPKNIRESSLKSLKKMVLNESNQNFTHLKPYAKLIIRECKTLHEGFWDDAWAKTKEYGTSAWEGLKQLGSDTWQGTKDLGSAISKGDYNEALKILGRGILYLARKIRSALHNPIGLILDTILVVSGIGKAIQWIPWAIVVALDIYELSTGDYEDKTQPQWMRILLFSCDVLGLVISGLVATGAMKYILRNGLKYATMSAFLRGTRKDPEGQKYLLQMEDAYSNNGYIVRLTEAEKYVTPRNSKIGNFLGEQKQNSSILKQLFQKEVQTPAMELTSQTTSTTGGPLSWTSSSTIPRTPNNRTSTGEKQSVIVKPSSAIYNIFKNFIPI